MNPNGWLIYMKQIVSKKLCAMVHEIQAKACCNTIGNSIIPDSNRLADTSYRLPVAGYEL